MWPRAFALILLACAPLAQQPPSDDGWPRVPAVQVTLSRPGADELPDAMTGRDLRIERFVLYDRSGPRVEVAGFVEWRKRETAHGQQMECDARFLREPAIAGGPRVVERVLHVECLTDRGPSCFWREVGPGTGRFVQAEWSPDGRALDLVEWSGAGKKRGTLVASGGASMPLYLVELLRQGGLTAGSIVRFDPLARTLDPLEVRTVWLDESGPLSTPVATAEESRESNVEHDEGDASAAAPTNPRVRAVRTVELVRPDGTLAGRYRFAGRELVAFQWQEGTLFARAVGLEEFDRLVTLHAPTPASTRRPPVETIPAPARRE